MGGRISNGDDRPEAELPDEGTSVELTDAAGRSRVRAIRQTDDQSYETVTRLLAIGNAILPVFFAWQVEILFHVETKQWYWVSLDPFDWYHVVMIGCFLVCWATSAAILVRR